MTSSFFTDLTLPPHNTEIYICKNSYEWNYENGPQFYTHERENHNLYTNGPPAKKFLDFRLNNPIGIAAGPLLNAKWIEFFLQFGFSVPVYKTVRSIYRASHPPPNCVYIRTRELQGVEYGSSLELETGGAPATLEQLSITNSFGVPSLSPEIWMPDIEQANSNLQKGQLLIVSVLGTEGAGHRDLAADFAYTAAMAKEAGARVIEANFSCPNLVGSNSGMLYADAENAAQIAKTIRAAIGSTPLLLKIGSLPEKQLKEVITVSRPHVDGFAGINTIPANVRNPDGSQALSGEGRLRSGICGVAIRNVSAEFVRQLSKLREQRKDDFVIIGVGGMMNAYDLEERLRDGADLVMSATAAMWDPYLAMRWQQAYG